jgi:hypothetical protein
MLVLPEIARGDSLILYYLLSEKAAERVYRILYHRVTMVINSLCMAIGAGGSTLAFFIHGPYHPGVWLCCLNVVPNLQRFLLLDVRLARLVCREFEPLFLGLNLVSYRHAPFK